MLNNCSYQIDNELNLIKKFEKIISNKGKLKGKIQMANDTIKEGKEKQEDFCDFEEKVNKKERHLNNILEKIERNKLKEKNKEGENDNKKEKEIRERIKELKVFKGFLKFFENFF